MRLIQGNEACALGALHAGCTFYAGYPITPASEIMEHMARLLPPRHGVFVQMEDEIGALAAVIGAAWAGSKAMTATSGPGFSLMQENLGYAAMTETPCVVVDSQRMGPSTGLPTLPSQGDVMQARWGNHGDRAGVTLTASSVRQVYEVTVAGLNISEQYRLPVVLCIVSTDDRFRAAKVDWDKLEDNCMVHMPSFESSPMRILTQGFIGRTAEERTTTLGREGSDFSAAIFAYLLDAESVTIWKDVPGMFNADPKRFADTKLLSHISYREAIELSYFGASVIHPRTLQPLQQKHIPLYVRSFIDLDAPGSTIDDRSENDSLIPAFIVKPGQLLISITPRDLSFIVEENLSGIFWLFAQRNVRIDLMQNSALAFSVVVDDTPRAQELIAELRKGYEVRYNSGCELVTVRHYDEPTLAALTTGREVLLEQRSRTTARFVLRS